MQDMKYLDKPYNTGKYEKSLRFFNLPFIKKITSTILYPISGFIISVSLSLLILVLNLFTSALNWVIGADPSLLSFGFYLIFNTLFPLLIWALAIHNKTKNSKKAVNNKIEKQKYLVNRLVELYNNRLKLLRFLEKDPDHQYIAEKEVSHIRDVLEKILPKVEIMKSNIIMHAKNKEFLSKFSIEKDGIYKVFDELKELDRQISDESKRTIEKFSDDAYIFEAFDNIEKDMKDLDLDNLDLESLTLDEK